MNIREIQRLFENCECGKEHVCPIDEVTIGENVLQHLKEVCKNYHSILLVSDNNTYKVCGQEVYELLKNKISNNLIFDTGNEFLVPNEKAIETIKSKLTKDTDLIIGVGSGVINDLCKYVSFFEKLPYFIVATAPSMDGYASSGAAMILDGMKVTVTTLPPRIIIAEARVLKNAPIEMLKAGYGDIIGKFSCLNDWKLSTLINGEYFCQEIYDYTLKCATDIKDKAKNILARDSNAVCELMEDLVMIGILMSFAGSTRPGSGSEHHLSHFFEITGILDGKKHLSHGIDVIYSTYYTQKIRENLLKINEPQCVDFSYQDYEKKIRSIYTVIADEVLALQDKTGWYKNPKTNIYGEKWQEIKAVLAEAPSSAEIKGYIDAIGLNLEDFVSLYGEEKINTALLYAKDLKDRYSVLWPYFELNK